MKRISRIRSAVLCAAATVLIVPTLAPPATACNTPVFRYAMYNWPTAPYYVFYFHHGQIADEDKAINKKIDALQTADTPTNVVLEAVDLSKEDALERFPKVVQEAHKRHAKGQEPLYLVYSSWGVEQFAGRLDKKTLAAMIGSPMRKQICDAFSKKSAAVFLIVTGPDEKANKRAEKAVAEVVALGAAGKIPVAGTETFGYSEQYMPEKDETEDDKDQNKDDQKKPEPDKEEEDPNRLKLGVLKLDRSDPAERWLTGMLMSVESDLQEYVDKHPKEPLVFAVYGRGRAMPPYVGKGITAENLADCTAFLAGACSCMVKDQNPGKDLLIQCNWDKTAEIMAEDDPEIGQDPYDYQEYPGEEPDEKKADSAESQPDRKEPPKDSPPKTEP